MAEGRKYLMVRFRRTIGFPPYLKVTEVASRCGIHPELVERFVCLGLIDPVGRDVDDELVFESDVIPLVRKIMRLRNHLGINYAGVGLVLELLSRIEELEAQLHKLLAED